MKRNLLAILCYACCALPFAVNIYLMSNRPVVMVDGRPNEPPKDWLCGRSLGPSYCVRIGKKDRIADDIAFALFFLVGFPYMIITVKRSSAKRAGRFPPR